MIGIYANETRPLASDISENLTSSLLKRGVECVKLSADFAEKPDLIVVIGGDGTVLDVALKAAVLGSPILVINAGSVGFLSCFEANEIEACAEFIAGGKFAIEERPLLCLEREGKTFYALNEVSVQRVTESVGMNCTLSLSFKIDGEFVEGFRADGIIIATPTGSTAYSLSAGGAILAPSINALIATPLCAHTLSSKPIVFSDSSSVDISVDNSVKGGVFLDGRLAFGVSQGDIVTVKKSNISTKFIKGKRTFYDALFRKLSSWNING